MNAERRRVLRWLAVGGLVLLVVLFAALQSDRVRHRLGLSVPEAYGGKLSAAAQEFNAKLPMMVNAETRLDSTAAIGEEFHYNYTLVRQQRSDVDPDQLTSALRPSLTRSVCGNAQLREFMSPGVDLVYNYAANDGAHIVSIRIERDACSS